MSDHGSFWTVAAASVLSPAEQSAYPALHTYRGPITKAFCRWRRHPAFQKEFKRESATERSPTSSRTDESVVTLLERRSRLRPEKPASQQPSTTVTESVAEQMPNSERHALICEPWSLAWEWPRNISQKVVQAPAEPTGSVECLSVSIAL